MLSAGGLASWQTDHLFLLIGENPLPNWAATRLLLRPGGTVHLVYTDGKEGTGAMALRLQKVLELDGVTVKTVALRSASDDREVYSSLKRNLEGIAVGSVGLHYTGGTKSMAVHAHRAVREQRQNAVFSYLDAHKLALRFDGTTGSWIVALDKRVRIGRDILFRLHADYPEKEFEFTTTPHCPQAAAALAQLHSLAAGRDAWKTWLNHAAEGDHSIDVLVDPERFADHMPKGGRSKGARDRQRKEVMAGKTLPSVDFLTSFVVDSSEKPRVKKAYLGFLQALQEDLPPPGTPFAELALRHGFRNAEDLAGWLHGKWLEHHTLVQVQACGQAASLNTDGIAMNIKPVTDTHFGFEADVLALRGYQLFFLSCTTDKEKKLVKHKLFEALLRARQLGGDEARVAVVSTSENPDAVHREAEAGIRTQLRVRVFGRRDLLDLRQGLEQWFNRQGREQE